MAGSWGASFGASFGLSFGGTGVAPPDPLPSGHPGMYGGTSAYRVKDSDVDGLMRLLFRSKRKKRKVRVKELEDAAMAVLMQGPEVLPAIRVALVDYATPLLEGRARQARLQTIVEAFLQRAAQIAAEENEIEQDDEEVISLLN